MKDDFISTVTHELRTPLTSIRVCSEILADNSELESVERQRFLALIIKESARLTRLINQVLDLAKLKSELSEWHNEILDLRDILREAVNLIESVFNRRRITRDLKLPAGKVAVRGDRDRIMQVLLNLLSNAVKLSNR